MFASDGVHKIVGEQLLEGCLETSGSGAVRRMAASCGKYHGPEEQTAVAVDDLRGLHDVENWEMPKKMGPEASRGSAT